MKKIFLQLILLAAGLPAFAQGSLSGSIGDEKKEPLVGATIYVREIGQGQIADKSGKFRFPNLKSGHYTVDISFIGYEAQSAGIDVNDQGTAKLDVVLKPGSIQLADITVSSSPDRPINTLSKIDIKFRPINTSQDILRMVPGLFIAQHAGGGKAEQIFLRGFDCDHGTDINIEVDGIPVNMVSHAHGQGYADLHFLMPEMVNYVDFDKGPYFAEKGDMNTAGYVSFQTKNRMDRNFVKLEGGSFGSARLAGGVNLFETTKSNAFVEALAVMAPLIQPKEEGRAGTTPI
jgi:hypothetical protein